ncbi:hypothetical protein ACFVZD_34175 [Streptomyces sp. NPDC058287]|uniref:hypothetical protein n=1 Tax=unclassified Streptomyces TaxID=2593676 RepID=UPI0036EF5DDD
MGETPTGHDGVREGFEALWCATDLGDYRPCGATYDLYPYDSLPPLDPAQHTGAFEWLAPARDAVPAQVTRLDGLTAELALAGLGLPRDFVTFHADPLLSGSLDHVSVTGCWTDISVPLPSPVEPGAALVRFLRDQQDCVLWYLYLRSSGEPFIVHSEVDYEYEYEARRDGIATETNLDDAAEQWAALCWCAASFEEFAHRYWIENRLWRIINDGDTSSLEPHLTAYLHHYASGVSPVRSVSGGSEAGLSLGCCPRW